MVITLKPGCLETLAEDAHTLTAKFNDGSAATNFFVKTAPKEEPKKDTSAKPGKTTPNSRMMSIPGYGSSSSLHPWLCLLELALY